VKNQISKLKKDGLNFKFKKKCPKCKGTGTLFDNKKAYTCEECNGIGEIDAS